MTHFILATAGHVDHGKSTLVRALTGTDPDRLPEEKARGITIDLGFAHLSLLSPSGQSFDVGIVDVPGHEDFVRNMIAGVGSIDLALLVVAADDGWMPQSEEHLQILEYLGVGRAIVALTKCDLGDPERVEANVREKLRGTGFENAPIIPTSLHTSSEELRSAIARELAQLQPQQDIGKPRLFVDRTFTLRGPGTVVTGTLTGGTLQRGQTVFSQPRNLPARIRSLQTHGREVDQAGPATRTALNLPELTAKETIRRGDVICLGGFEPVTRIGALLRSSPRLRQRPPLKSGAVLYLHLGTTRVSARIILPDRAKLRPGEAGPAEIRLTTPLLAFVGDRFVLRDPSERHTLAGGVVVPLGAAPLLSASDALDGWVLAEIQRQRVLRRDAILRASCFSSGEIDAALQKLEANGKIVLTNEFAFVAEAWRVARQRAVDVIAHEHETHPERAGMLLSELRAALNEFPECMIEEIVSDLCASDFVKVHRFIAKRDHRRRLPPQIEVIADEIIRGLSGNPVDPPSQRATTSQARAAIDFLIGQGEVVQLAPDVFVLGSAFAEMKQRAADFISAHGRATVSQLRRELGTSRRIAVPLLELFDKQGFTRRVGDERVLVR